MCIMRIKMYMKFKILHDVKNFPSVSAKNILSFSRTYKNYFTCTISFTAYTVS